MFGPIKHLNLKEWNVNQDQVGHNMCPHHLNLKEWNVNQ